MTKPEDLFGVNAGKVWSVLKEKGPSSARAIAKEAEIKISDVFGALGWLGREGKIKIVNAKRGLKYKLVE